MIKMIIFDMAGTIVNEYNLVYKCLHDTLVSHGHKVSLEFILEFGAGKEKKQAIEEILHRINGIEPLDFLVNEYYTYFSHNLLRQYRNSTISIFEGTIELFTYLKFHDIKIVLNTGYSCEIANLIMQSLNIKLELIIDLLICADLVEQGRPSPAMIFKACEQFNISPSETIKVGDTIIDIQEGLNAGVSLSIGITTGAQSRSMLSNANPHYIIDKLQELMPIIEQTNAYEKN